MIAGFISLSPLGPRELGRTLDRMADRLVTSADQKANRVLHGPHIAGIAFAPGDKSPTYRARTIAWLDGEFYNRSDGPTTDAEFFARAAMDGRESLNPLDGIFAGAVFAPRKRKLHLVTDRHGLRPLYYARLGDLIAWASQTKAFLALPDFSPAIDPIARDIFLATGQLPSDRTWLKGVLPVPPATRLTFRLSDGRLAQQPYWSWDEIAPIAGEPRELADELGTRFRVAVERRTTRQTGLTLSGGLDSRAILAAMPHAPQTFTFGHPDSADVRIAARVASLKNAPHEVLPLHDQNWLSPRLPGVWWTDGALDLLHMHGIEHLKRQRAAYRICLNGVGGDGLAGAGHLFHPRDFAAYLKDKLHIAADRDILHHLETAFHNSGSAHAFYIDWRVRGFTIHGPRLGLFEGIEYRLPFFDNRVQELLYAIPLQQRADNRLYKCMLLQTFPKYFKRIPWQATGFPISHPSWVVKPLRRIARWRRRAPRPFADYANWLRQPPGKYLGDRLLGDARGIVDLWKCHLAGEDHTAILGRHLTFELYLRQLFDDKYRTLEEANALLKGT